MKFALACEGITDQISIENILSGYIEEDVSEDTTYLQPPFDETDKKQSDFGGWELLFGYLASTRFKEDVINNEYVIVQVDTDASENEGFNIRHTDSCNKELEENRIIENVVKKLVSLIDSKECDFYEKHSHKIIFSISVHSLECWIYAYYNYETPKKSKRNHVTKKSKTKGCFKALTFLLKKNNKFKSVVISKNYKSYDMLTRPFRTKKCITKAAEGSKSLAIFLEQLDRIDYEKSAN